MLTLVWSHCAMEYCLRDCDQANHPQRIAVDNEKDSGGQEGFMSRVFAERAEGSPRISTPRSDGNGIGNVGIPSPISLKRDIPGMASVRGSWIIKVLA